MLFFHQFYPLQIRGSGSLFAFGDKVKATSQERENYLSKHITFYKVLNAFIPIA